MKAEDWLFFKEIEATSVSRTDRLDKIYQKWFSWLWLIVVLLKAWLYSAISEADTEGYVETIIY